MEILIAYAGKTGTTEKCAETLAQKLNNVTVIDLVKEIPDVDKYDAVIVGGSIRVGMLHSKAKDFIKANKDILLNKKAAYYVCCSLSEGYEKYFEENIDKELLEKSLTYNTFGGEMDISKQKGFSKIITKIVNKAVESGKVKAFSGISNENIDEFANIINKA